MAISSDDASSVSRSNIGPAIIESMWILMFAASLVMIARFYVRARLIKKIALDDWVMLFAYVRPPRMSDS